MVRPDRAVVKDDGKLASRYRNTTRPSSPCDRQGHPRRIRHRTPTGPAPAASRRQHNSGDMTPGSGASISARWSTSSTTVKAADSLVRQRRFGALVRHADPTPWRLHRFWASRSQLGMTRKSRGGIWPPEASQPIDLTRNVACSIGVSRHRGRHRAGQPVPARAAMRSLFSEGRCPSGAADWAKQRPWKADVSSSDALDDRVECACRAFRPRGSRLAEASSSTAQRPSRPRRRRPPARAERASSTRRDAGSWPLWQ
jgi:hypothetical protein